CILYQRPPKNRARLADTPVLPSSRGFTVDQTVTNEIGMAKGGVYHHSIAWGQPYWAFMAYHPEVKHFLASQSNAMAGTAALQVYSFPQFPAYGHAVPIRIPDKASAGLTWIGNLLFALGPEWVFAAGNGVETRFP